jgi:acyl-CoA thioester hydrolase
MSDAATGFELELAVRDYEVDLQGIVNNAVYQHYLEHARHEFLRSRGVDFAALHALDRDLVVTRVEMDFKSPLRSRDRFTVTVRVHRVGRLRMAFEQRVLRLPERRLAVDACVTGVCLRAGRPVRPEEVLDVACLGIE